MINTQSNSGGEDRNMDEADQGQKQFGNVVLFPGISKNRPPQSIEEICRNVEIAKTNRIEEVVENVVLSLFEDLYTHTFDFSDRDDVNKDMAFLIETIKSMLYKHDGMEHPFHQLAEEQFAADANGDIHFIGGLTSEEVSELNIKVGDETGA